MFTYHNIYIIYRHIYYIYTCYIYMYIYIYIYKLIPDIYKKTEYTVIFKFRNIYVYTSLIYINFLR